MTTADPLKPTASLLVKLGSMVVHADEAILGANGTTFDVQAFSSLLRDPEVAAWMKEMSKMAFLPVKR